MSDLFVLISYCVYVCVCAVIFVLFIVAQGITDLLVKHLVDCIARTPLCLPPGISL